MTRDQWDDLTSAQRLALEQVWMRHFPEQTKDEVIQAATAPAGAIQPYVGITTPYGMFIGIEPDGYTHT